MTLGGCLRFLFGRFAPTTFKRAPLLVAGFAAFVTIALAGCAGGAEDAPATATPDTFDRELLRAVVLQPDEISALSNGGTFTDQGTSVTYSEAYTDGAYEVRVTVARVPDDIEREERFRDLRSSVDLLIGGERNYDLSDSDLAFAFKAVVEQTPNYAVLALKEPFILLVTVMSDDEALSDRVFDEDLMAAYVETMFARVTMLATVGGLTPAPPERSGPSPAAD